MSKQGPKGTHWVAIPVPAFNNYRPEDFIGRASTEFARIGKIVEGPWYVKTTEGEQLLAGGRVMGPSMIFYARMANA